MNTEHKLIKLYRTRTFSEKMSDTFDFVRENLRILLKYITYLLLPVALVQTFCMTNFMTGYLQTINVMVSGKSNPAEMASWMLSMALMVLVMYVGMILLVAMVYSMMQLYEQRPGLQGITFADIKTSFFRMSGRQLVLLVTNIVFYLVFALIIVVMVAISPYMILPAVVLSIVVMPLLVLVYPVYLFENMGVISAYAKGIRLGWKTWGGVVVVILVLYIIASILQGLVATPWYIMMTVKNVLAAQGATAGFVSSFPYTAIQYLLGVASNFFSSCMFAIVAIGVAYQYGHACDKVDGVGVDQAIKDFETF